MCLNILLREGLVGPVGKGPEPERPKCPGYLQKLMGNSDLRCCYWWLHRASCPKCCTGPGLVVITCSWWTPELHPHGRQEQICASRLLSDTGSQIPLPLTPLCFSLPPQLPQVPPPGQFSPLPRDTQPSPSTFFQIHSLSNSATFLPVLLLLHQQTTRNCTILTFIIRNILISPMERKITYLS